MCKKARRENVKPPVKHFLLDLDMFETFGDWYFLSADAMLIRRPQCVAPPPCCSSPLLTQFGNSRSVYS